MAERMVLVSIVKISWAFFFLAIMLLVREGKPTLVRLTIAVKKSDWP